MEVIFKAPGQPFKNHSTYIEKQKVEQTLRELKTAIIRGYASNAIALSENVYSWLIEPWSDYLENSDRISTLVFVLDGELRNRIKSKARDLDRFLYSRDRQKSIELLVLSACETAQGDTRAALGLAGLAIRAGAKSTLATLWQVNDQSTVKFMERFYQELNVPGTSKAIAVHRAQNYLLNQSNYQAPFYWAPYVLVGNWK